MNTQLNCNNTPDWTDSLNQLASCYSKYRKALSFSFTFFRDSDELWKTKKKALAIFLKADITTESSNEKYRGKKKTSTIVDVDDKNCLAELTVVLKSNHGVRQWLYIIAGVLFFVTFFCTSKRKYINFSSKKFYVLFALMQKEPKKSSPARCSDVHKLSNNLVHTLRSFT